MSKGRFTLPETTNFNEIGIELRANYTHANPQRLSFLDLYDKLTSSEQAELLVFEFEFIEQTYKYLSAERSQMYALLHKILGEISLDDRLIELNRLRRYANEKLTDEMVKCVTWPTRAAFIKVIDSTIQYLVQVKEKARINRLLHTKPDLIALKNNIKEHEQSYKQSLTGRMFSPNPQREAASTYVDFFSETCDEIYGIDYIKKTRDENQKDPNYTKNYQRHVGIYLFALLQINNECTFFSPKSRWFRDGLVAIGYTSVDDIPVDEKILWLNRARKHLEKVKIIYSAKPGKTEGMNAYQELIEEWQSNRKLPNLDDLHFKIGEVLHGLEKTQHEPSLMVGTAKSATAAVASRAIEAVAIRYITAYALVPAATTAIAGLIAGPVGAAIGAFVGPFIGQQISYQVSERLIPWAVGNLSSTLIERIGGKLGDGAAAAAFAIFTTGGLAHLKGFYDKNISDKFDDDFVMVLLDLPEVSKDDKKKIRKIWGVPDPDLPKTASVAPSFHSLRFFDNYDADKQREQTSAVVPANVQTIN